MNEDSMNGNVETRAYLEKKLVFCFGSYVASQLLLPFGEENILSSSELKDAQEVVAAFNLLFCTIIASLSDFNWSLVQIATRMVIQYAWGPDDSPTIYHHGNAVLTYKYIDEDILIHFKGYYMELCPERVIVTLMLCLLKLYYLIPMTSQLNIFQTEFSSFSLPLLYFLTFLLQYSILCFFRSLHFNHGSDIC